MYVCIVHGGYKDGIMGVCSERIDENFNNLLNII